MKSRSRYLALILVVLAVIAVPEPQAQLSGCPPQDPNTNGWPMGTSSQRTTVTYDVSTMSDPEKSAVVDAFNAWNGSPGNCLNINFQQQTGGTYLLLTAGSGGACGSGKCAPAYTTGTNDPSTGALQTAITVFDFNNQKGTWFDRSNATQFRTAVLKVALHDIGHTMGLGDMPNNGDAATCGGQTAGKSVMNGMCGVNDSRNNLPTSVQPCDTQSVNQNVQCQPPPPPEPPPDVPACFDGTPEEYLNEVNSCETGNGSVYDTERCRCIYNLDGSPVIIDLTGDGFRLTSAADGVTFDIFGNGHPERIGWTHAGSAQAFLILDRNRNGLIDSGKELFGDATHQPASSGRNGFLALAEYDKPENGGNADGVIDSGDAIFSSLRLWVDLNHNGISETEELIPLPNLGVYSISLDYREDRRTDGFGNIFRYRAKVNEHMGTAVGTWAYDVILVIAPVSTAVVRPPQGSLVLGEWITDIWPLAPWPAPHERKVIPRNCASTRTITF